MVNRVNDNVTRAAQPPLPQQTDAAAPQGSAASAPRRPSMPGAQLDGLRRPPGVKTTATNRMSRAMVAGEFSTRLPVSGDKLTEAAEIRNALDAPGRANKTVTVHLDVFRDNFRKVADFVEQNHIGEQPPALSAVLKADAYGAGAVKVAQALEKAGCKQFFVATLDEAIEMRKGVKDDSSVYVLGGPLPGTAHQFVEHNITPVLNSVAQVKQWNELGQRMREAGQLPADKKLGAILQFDTGMSRQGIAPKDRAKVAQGSDALANIDVQYVMSHLATAGEAGVDERKTPADAQIPVRAPSASMEKQRAEFDKIRDEYKGVKASLAASSALHIPEYQYDMVRVGGAIHGQHLFDDEKGRYKQPVEVTTRLTEVRELEEGDGIGYGLVYNVQNPDPKGKGKATGEDKDAYTEFSGTISAGYADGTPRGVGSTRDDGKNVSHGYVKIDGHKAPITGNISMDMSTINLSGVVDAKKKEAESRMKAEFRDRTTDPDLRVLDEGERLKTADGIFESLSKSKIVFSDDDRPFDDVAKSAKSGGDKRVNVSKVAIDFGADKRGIRVYSDKPETDSGQQ